MLPPLARDLLVVSALGERDKVSVKLIDDTWLSPLHDALYPPKDMFRSPAPAPGCTFNGLHRGRTPYRIWYGRRLSQARPSPSRSRQSYDRLVRSGGLDLRERRSMGLRYEDVLTGSPQAGLDLYRSWHAARNEIIGKAGKPLFEIELATGATLLESPQVETVSVVKSGTRPAGRAFGKLVHALLQQCPIPPDADQIQSIAMVEARILGSEEDMIEPAIHTAMEALRHPLLAGIATANRLHREFPVLLRRGDAFGQLIEGVIDLAFSDGASWTIVDFKTGPGDKKRNRGQLELYRQAIAQATGLPVRAVLFEI